MNKIIFQFSGYILYIIRQHRVLSDRPTAGNNAIQHVHEHLSTDRIRRTIGGSRSRRRDECPKRRVPRACDVSTVPTLLRVLR